MTRINAGVNPKDLHQKHLLAELREIIRIPNSLRKARLEGIPERFCLGTGHVRFFYDKGKYTHKRYLRLREEALRRGYNVQNFSDSWDVYKKKKFSNLYNDWRPTMRDKEIIINRINERLKTMK